MEKLCKIRTLQRAIVQIESCFEKKYGISLNEGMTLCSLKKEKKLSSGEICEMLGLTNSNTSKVLKSVEKKGYIKRVIGKEDKRQMYFSLTEAGEALIGSVNCENIEIPEVVENLLESDLIS